LPITVSPWTPTWSRPFAKRPLPKTVKACGAF
jgi:hypothetical protein